MNMWSKILYIKDVTHHHLSELYWLKITVTLTKQKMFTEGSAECKVGHVFVPTRQCCCHYFDNQGSARPGLWLVPILVEPQCCLWPEAMQRLSISAELFSSPTTWHPCDQTRMAGTPPACATTYPFLLSLPMSQIMQAPKFLQEPFLLKHEPNCYSTDCFHGISVSALPELACSVKERRCLSSLTVWASTGLLTVLWNYSGPATILIYVEWRHMARIICSFSLVIKTSVITKGLQGGKPHSIK